MRISPSIRKGIEAMAKVSTIDFLKVGSVIPWYVLVKIKGIQRELKHSILVVWEQPKESDRG